MKKLRQIGIWLLAINALLMIGYAWFVRPYHMRWGATDEEIRMPLPGDAWISPDAVVSTRALTIGAPAEAVWPWLVQMGQGRGGFYSYSWLENLFAADMHNAEEIHPAWQSVRVGDRWSLQKDGPAAEVTLVLPKRAVCLGGWTFFLQPVNENTTRLVVRYPSFGVKNQPLSALYYYAIFEPTHFLGSSSVLVKIRKISGLASMETSLLFPSPFVVCNSSVSEQKIRFGVMSKSHNGICPLCRQPSSRIHNYYHRQVADLPISGKSVQLFIHARKFFCEHASCPRKIFTERWGDDLLPYQRRLKRATAQVRLIALMMGGNPGGKLARLVGLPVSASTVLRILKQTPFPVQHTPKAVGVDDFAFKKGQVYGTILVDLYQGKPLDLLADRDGKTLEAWLNVHPGIELLTRDRSSVYAAAITAACPQAVQVADRWHLLKNLSQQWERLLDRERTLIQQTTLEIHPIPSVQPPDLSSVIAQLQQADVGEDLPREKRYSKYQQVKRLQEEGHSVRAIARHLAMSRRTVSKYFHQERFVPKTKTKRSNLLAFDPYLRQRWQEGETNGKSLLREIRALGYNGSYTILMNWLANFPPTAEGQALPAADQRYTYSNRSLSIAFCQPEKDGDPEKKPLLQKLLEKSPRLQQARELSLAFKSLMEQKKGEGLESWCQQASQLPAFSGFVRGIRQDFQAVQQALSSPCSNGQTEGQVNRLKNIKRQMYGRASFGLLRLRVLAGSG